jgi:DNA-binding MarR family transcriptional regulator
MSPAKHAEERLLQSTYELSRVLRQKMMTECKPEERSANFLHVHGLMIVSEQPGITMKELAASLHVTSPSATTLVDKLVQLHWVDRIHDEKNRKLVRLRSTEEGAKVLSQHQRKGAAVMRKLFGLLTTHEQETLTILHEKILRLHKAHSSH